MANIHKKIEELISNPVSTGFLYALYDLLDKITEGEI